MGKAYGVESHVLSPAETKALYPLMNVDDLYGTLYVPHDGTMDPAGTCTALTRAAAARGAQVPKAAWPCAPRSWPQEPREPKERKQVPFSLLCDPGPGDGLSEPFDLLLQRWAVPRGMSALLPSPRLWPC